ncbi:hypothetical protein QE370_003314 [Aeromicrobium sp. SORGH_AS981]|uniref:hypothetical protein n=1 Tax=Aeromicrobium sp. SORGH_AS_0981 TaxID=3041802 RepID=UPI00285E356F|nr:hypothetical protein [Aeromicrobium sp. SORGH_AS_0981]MDR6120130.1 hypothetical protein [Aeromicrobium sp. SORGH_AS_0981]
MRRVGWVLVAVVLAGCGGTGGGGERDSTPSSAPSTTLPDDPTPTLPDDDPTPTAKPSAGLQSVTGVVERSPEDRCVTLAATGRTWVLTGTVAGMEAGDRVTVRGRPDPDATTTCQRGPVLVVVEVERG